VSFGQQFVALDKIIHDRDSFDCGENALNIFLKTQAYKHMKVGVSNTMVLAAVTTLANGKYPICSYYTVAPSSIKRATLPATIAEKLPHYPVPVFLLAQLAVDKNYHGQKLGRITLIKALEFLWKINLQMSAFAVIVDCLNSEVEKFYTKFRFQLLDKHNGKTRMYISMQTVEKLFI